MTSPKSAAPGASAGASSSRTQRKGNPRQTRAGARTAGPSTNELPDEFRTIDEPLNLQTEITGGLADSVRLARQMVNDQTLPAYVRVRAMDFFVKNQHLATAADPGGKTLRDEFMELMAEIRSVPKVVVTTPAAEELEEEDEPVARFEAATS